MKKKYKLYKNPSCKLEIKTKKVIKRIVRNRDDSNNILKFLEIK